MRILRTFQSPALLSHLGNYTIGKNHYVVFPWAEHGSLRDFWRNNPEPAQLSGDVEFWLIQQCWRISDALQTLHRSYARHGDMKPDNILVFATEQARTAKVNDIHNEQGVAKTSRNLKQDQIKLLDEQLRSRISEQETICGKTTFTTIQEIDRKVEALREEANSSMLKLADEREALTEISNLHKQRNNFAHSKALQKDIEGALKKDIENLKARIQEIKDSFDNSKIPTRLDSLANQEDAFQFHDSEEATNPNLGELKLADFGLSRVHKFPEESAPGKSTAFSPTYRSPEFDITNTAIGRRADVWSLGCVFLEFVTWYVLGTAGLDDFGEARFGTNGLLANTSRFVEDTFFSIKNSEDGRPMIMQNPAITKVLPIRSKPPWLSLNTPRLRMTRCNLHSKLVLLLTKGHF